MAKSTLNLREAQQLCTAQEFALVRAAQPREIGQWSGAQLRKKIERARDLRDKWKDQSKAKKREAQQAKGRREVDAATRSRAKAALFADVLKAFQARAAEVRESESATEPKRKTSKKSAAKKAASATVKKTTPAKKSAAKKPVTKKTASKKAAGALVAAAGKKKSKKSAKKSGRGTDNAGNDHTETERLVLHPGLTHRGADLRPGGGADAAPFVETPLHLAGSDSGVDAGGRIFEPAALNQLRAQTAVKQRKINASGLRSRVKGHVSSRTRRAQAKRDS